MKIKKLSLANFRCFEHAEFEFNPGMNVIVGENGAGKTTVLDAIRIMLSRIYPSISISSQVPISYNEFDMKIGKEYIVIKVDCKYKEIDFDYLNKISRKDFVLKKMKFGQKMVVNTPNIDQYSSKNLNSDNLFQEKEILPQSFPLFFSSLRSTASEKEVNKGFAAGSHNAAFNNSLRDREFLIKDFAEWIYAREELSKEAGHRDDKVLKIKSFVKNFIDNCDEISAEKDENEKVSLFIIKETKKLNMKQLSDGEKVILCFVLDIAKRMMILNPNSRDPFKEGEAIILIDELDLHLHPKWQREIVGKLTETFPNCQFICTTHSPLIIGEVDPENIIILDEGKPPYHPDRSSGMDSNWIIRHIMGGSDRNIELAQKLLSASDLIDKEKYDKAEKITNEIYEEFGDFEELIKLKTKIDRIRLLADEIHKKTKKRTKKS